LQGKALVKAEDDIRWLQRQRLLEGSQCLPKAFEKN
jgi:hypothetical protein